MAGGAIRVAARSFTALGIVACVGVGALVVAETLQPPAGSVPMPVPPPPSGPAASFREAVEAQFRPALLDAPPVANAVPTPPPDQDGGEPSRPTTLAAVAPIQPAPVLIEPPAPLGGLPAAAPPNANGKVAKVLFGAAREPAPLAARAIGSYARGCLAGARALPIDGPAWQAMRLSRNRNWGHPRTIALVEKLATDAKANNEWPGLLVGDISQPRGGPMLTGHASHQVGLDADIWLTPMPDRRLTEQEREDISAISMLDSTSLAVDRKIWSARHLALIKRAASMPEVERVLVHPAIKKAICLDTAKDSNRAWLIKVRPIFGHHYHFHIRIGCPRDSPGCVTQPAPPGDDGCGKELDDWFKLLTRPPPKPSDKPEPPKPPMTLDQLPHDCRVVLGAGAKTPMQARN
jgi:penicillin-insensitive murein endopeptidase